MNTMRQIFMTLKISQKNQKKRQPEEFIQRLAPCIYRFVQKMASKAYVRSTKSG